MESEAKDGKEPEAQEKPQPGKRFESTLPMGRTPPQESRRNGEGELDLDVGDIQSRLPYGSEDLADK